MRLASIFGLLILAAGCAQQQPSVPIAPQPIESNFDSTPGPTLMARVAGGYELRNRKYSVIISHQTGDVIFWGRAGENRNMVMNRGIYSTLTALPDAPPHMMVQARDEQTWEFYGEDDNHIIWRKAYCLEKDALLVSVLILNNRKERLDTAIQINGELIGARIAHQDLEQFDAINGYGSVSLHGYNEFHNPTSQPYLPTLLQSDTFHLKPQERIGYTSVWKLSP